MSLGHLPTQHFTTVDTSQALLAFRNRLLPPVHNMSTNRNTRRTFVVDQWKVVFNPDSPYDGTKPPSCGSVTPQYTLVSHPSEAQNDHRTRYRRNLESVKIFARAVLDERIDLTSFPDEANVIITEMGRDIQCLIAPEPRQTQRFQLSGIDWTGTAYEVAVNIATPTRGTASTARPSNPAATTWPPTV